MKTAISVIVLTLTSLSLMTSCKPKNTEVKKAANAEVSFDSPKVKEEIIKIVNTLPSNTETVELINSTGAGYLAGFTGEDLKTENLLTRADKAKAYGTIIFDLVYTHTYNQTESFSKLVKIYETLTRDLGFEELAESQKEFKNRYQQNKDNADSVDFLVTDMLNTTNDFIQRNGSASDVSLVFAGAVVKSLNVISYLTLFAPAKDKLITVLQKQKEVVNGTCMILEKSPADAEVSKLYQQLVPVNTLFNSTESFTVQTVEQINKLTDHISAQ
jgi:hypothetical protein